MKKTARPLAFVLAALLLLTGCRAETPAASSAQESAGIYTAAGTLPIVTEPVALKVFMSQPANIVDFETNAGTKYLEEQTGIDLQIDAVPAAAAKEEINVKLLSGDYPDIFLGCAALVDEVQYGVNQGILLDMTGLLDKMPQLQAILRTHPTMREALAASDGKLYKTPAFYDSYHSTFPGKLWGNTAHLEALGLGVPTTLDEFYTVCKKFKEENPTGIALAGYLNGWNGDPVNFIANAFTYRGLDRNGLRVKDGVVDSALVTAEYRQALQFLSRLYAEDLLYEAAFTMDVQQMKALLLESGEPVLFFPAGASINLIDAAANGDVYSHYSPIAPLEGPGGVRYASYSPITAGAGSSITTACEYPEAAARLLDFCFAYETYKHLNMGEEGTDWAEADENALGLAGEPALVKRLRAYSLAPQNVNWLGVPVCYAPAEYLLGEQTDPEVDQFSPEGLETLLYNTTKALYAPYAPADYGPLPALKFLAEENSALQPALAALEKKIPDYTVQFITGKADAGADADWEAYVAALQAAGLQTLVELNQKAYDRQYGAAQ